MSLDAILGFDVRSVLAGGAIAAIATIFTRKLYAGFRRMDSSAQRLVIDALPYLALTAAAGAFGILTTNIETGLFYAAIVVGVIWQLSVIAFWFGQRYRLLAYVVLTLLLAALLAWQWQPGAGIFAVLAALLRWGLPLWKERK